MPIYVKNLQLLQKERPQKQKQTRIKCIDAEPQSDTGNETNSDTDEYDNEDWIS